MRGIAKRRSCRDAHRSRRNCRIDRLPAVDRPALMCIAQRSPSSRAREIQAAGINREGIGERAPPALQASEGSDGTSAQLDRNRRVQSRFFEDVYLTRSTSSSMLMRAGLGSPVQGTQISTAHLDVTSSRATQRCPIRESARELAIRDPQG